MPAYSPHHSDGILVGAVKGALAGAVGTWALDQVSTALYATESKAHKKEEERARPGGKDPATLLAERSARATDCHMTKDETAWAATTAHFALGVGPGAVYGAVRGAVGGGPAAGLLLGLGLFLVQDELLNWAAGTAGPPAAYPWQAHARGLAAHLAFGLATEASLTALDAVA